MIYSNTNGIQCKRCGSTNSAVLDSRPANGTQRRRRKCMDCNYRFSTKEVWIYEFVNYDAELSEIRRLLFDAQRLINELVLK